MKLVLYSRQGCCLCKGLEEKLRGLDGAPALQVVDVDRDPELQARFGLEVPVLAREGPQGELQLLPRVSPRLGGTALLRWLNQQHESLG